MERAIIYCAKTGLEATDHFVPELLEKYCKDNGYEIVAMLSEPASTEGVSFPMKYAFIGLNMEEDANTIITLICVQPIRIQSSAVPTEFPRISWKKWC